MCMEKVYRRMHEEDLPQVAAIEAASFSEPWSEDGFRRSLSDPNTLYVTAEVNGQTVGYAGYLRSFEEADITNVAVREDMRGKKIASEMLAFLIREGEQEGVLRFTLEVRRSNGAALRVYEKLGFQTVGYRKNFYRRPAEDAAIMWRAEKETE